MKDNHFILVPCRPQRPVWMRVFEYAARILNLGDRVEIVVRVFRSKRSLEQNRRMWAMLTDISRQIPWVVNDCVVTMSAEDWKDVLTASLRSELRVARGIDGGMVLLGLRTSRMTVQRMSDLIDLMFAFGNARGVAWSDPNQLADNDAEALDDWREAA